MTDFITVVNVRGLKPVTAPPDLIYIGRCCAGWPQSPLHNPIKLVSGTSRDDAIEQYRRYLWTQMQIGNTSIVGELTRIAAIAHNGQPVKLGCWCAPLSCHGDVVKAAVLWLHSKNMDVVTNGTASR